MGLKRTTIYTQADLDNIDLAIGSGASVVEFQGKKHVYRKLSDLIRTRRWIYSCLCLANGERVSKGPMFRSVCVTDQPNCCTECGCSKGCNC